MISILHDSSPAHLPILAMRPIILLLTVTQAVAAEARTYTHSGPASSAGAGHSAAGPYAMTLSVGELGAQPVRNGFYAIDAGLSSRTEPAAAPQAPGAPVISQIADQTIEQGTTTQPLPITVTDSDTPLARLTFSRASSNPDLLPLAGITLGGTAGNRTVLLHPNPEVSGTAVVTLSASDDTHTTTMSFLLTVRAPGNPPASNGFGLPVIRHGAATAAAETSNRFEDWNQPLRIAGLATGPDSAVSLSLGNARGATLRTTSSGAAPGQGITLGWASFNTNLIVPGATLPWIITNLVIQCKWELSELDASRSVITVQSLGQRTAPRGASWRAFDASGRQLHVTTGLALPFGVVLALGDTATHEVGHWVGITDDSARFADSPPGHAVHLALTPGRIFDTNLVHSPPADARIILPDGTQVGGVHTVVFSAEGFADPVGGVDHLLVRGTGGLTSCLISDAGLWQDGTAISSGARTRIVASRDAAAGYFEALPEVDDEVLVNFRQAAPDSGVARALGLTDDTGEFAVPRLDPGIAGSSLTLITRRHPVSPAGDFNTVPVTRALRVVAGVTAGGRAGYRLTPESAAPGADSERLALTILREGVEIGTRTITAGQSLDLVGTGVPLRIRPGLPGDGERFAAPAIVFDAPMALEGAGASLTGDEFVFATDLGSATASISASLAIRSPGTTQYRIAPQGLSDWGDLPSAYPTTIAKNGARHRLVPGLRLGSRVDPESNGRPHPTASGDDRDRRDDEDGVNLLSALVPGTTATIQVRVTAPTAGAFLDAFADWNADGVLGDPGEKFLNSQPVVNGVNTFSVLVPASAKPGRTFARFRLSRTGGLGPAGPADSGEVEDYLVQVSATVPPNPAGGLVIVPHGGAELHANPDGTVELSDSAPGVESGFNIVPSPGALSFRAGRLVLPVNPPMPLVGFSSTTQPFADGLVLEVVASGDHGESWIPRLRLGPGNTPESASLSLTWDGTVAGPARLRVTGFDGSRETGGFVLPPGQLGELGGATGANLTRVVWTASPAGVLLVFDRKLLFTGLDGARIEGDRFRALFLDSIGDPFLPAGLTLASASVTGAGLGDRPRSLAGLRALNPRAPSVTRLTARSEGDATLEFPTEEDVFYRVETAESLIARQWVAATTATEAGTGGTSRVTFPATATPAARSRFFRLVAE